jgi:hypothetical protein
VSSFTFTVHNRIRILCLLACGRLLVVKVVTVMEGVLLQGVEVVGVVEGVVLQVEVVEWVQVEVLRRTHLVIVVWFTAVR